MASVSFSAGLSGVSPVDDVVEPAATQSTSAGSGTVTLSAALALPQTAEYPHLREVAPAGAVELG
ncbi:hypothetical protein PF003_g28912 [Phytophthora fragariae]|nr:hypothetical protein PF003_g28912 [Phytophthora fragariae]